MLYPLVVAPGIQRDGTKFSNRRWNDGLWTRFYRGLPRKMEGYSQLIGGLPNIVRGTVIIPSSPNFKIYMGDQATLKYFPMDISQVVLGPLVDRTPNLFAANVNNDWQFDSLFDTTTNGSTLIAYAGVNLSSIENTIETPIYFGNQNDDSRLIPTGLNVSGGIVSLYPHLFMFGNDGKISWTTANDPTTLLNTARVTGKKIVAGARTRGGNTSPAGLFWSLDSLIRATNTGPTAADYTFDTISDQISILSNKSIIEHDNIYYWVGSNRFMQYNGIVSELPNDSSLNFFFNNLNFSQRQKVFATKTSEWGEISFHFPMGTSLECNHEVIYNTIDKIWYDTPISRSCADFDELLPFPILAGNTPDFFGDYEIWAHETGVDQNVNGNLTAIASSVETCQIAWCAYGPDGKFYGLNKQVVLNCIEPDFIQSGNMTVFVNGKAYANSPVVTSIPYIFTNTTTKIDMKEQRRQMTIRFESNEVGGNYEMGNVLLEITQGDGRP